MNHEWHIEPSQKLTFLDERVNKVLKSLLIFLIPVIVVLGSVSLLTTDSYLTYEYGKLNFPADAYGFTPEQRCIMASTNVHYVQAHLPDNELAKQTLNGVPVYNEREVSHMADVQAVFQSILRLWQFALFLSVIVGLALWKNGQRLLFWSGVQWGGIVTSGLILIISFLAYFGWQTWFELFHRLFFLPGSWLFSYQDTLIRLFPMQFWFDATLTISFLSFTIGALLALLGWRGQKAIARRAADTLQSA
jgi:integral membrane protein (TIGR01906 family)